MAFSSDTICCLSDMLGKTFRKVEQVSDEQLIFWSENVEDSFSLFHDQDCCENVYLDDIIGDLSDLENSPILQAEEAHSSNSMFPKNTHAISYTWTFYKFATLNGSVTLRWYGESNGYYSESVNCHKWSNR